MIPFGLVFQSTQEHFRSTCICWSLLSSDEVWTNQFIPMLRAKLTKTTEELVPIFWTTVQSLHDCEPSEDVYSIKEWREISPGTRYISSRSLVQKDPGIWELQLDTSSDDGQINIDVPTPFDVGTGKETDKTLASGVVIKRALSSTGLPSLVRIYILQPELLSSRCHSPLFTDQYGTVRRYFSRKDISTAWKTFFERKTELGILWFPLPLGRVWCPSDVIRRCYDMLCSWRSTSVSTSSDGLFAKIATSWRCTHSVGTLCTLAPYSMLIGQNFFGDVLSR